MSVVGAVDRDLFGDWIARTLRDRGIVTHLERLPQRTSRNMILVLKGEDRRFHTDSHSGASWYLDPEYVKRVIRIEKPSLFYVGNRDRGKTR